MMRARLVAICGQVAEPRLLRLLIYLLVVTYLVLCGVVFFAELPRADATAVPLTQALRDAYEGYTVYLRRASLLCGLSAGVYAASIAVNRGRRFSLAMLLTAHLGNILLFLAALPPVRAGNAEYVAGQYYHAGAIVPAALAWLVATLRGEPGDWLLTRLRLARPALPWAQGQRLTLPGAKAGERNRLPLSRRKMTRK